MASYGKDDTVLAADDLQNLWNNFIPTSVTVTPWQCKLAEAIFKDTGDAKMKSFTGAQGWNTWIVNEMQKAYKKTSTPAYIVSKTKVSQKIANSFVKNLPVYQGMDIREGLVSATVDALTGAAHGLEKAGEGLPFIFGILAVGIAGYLIFAGRKGVNLIPKIPSLK